MDERIVLLDEMDNEIEFDVLATFGLDDIDYAALLPVDEIDGLTYILRIEYDDEGNPMLMGIDDDQELEDAIKAFEEIQREKQH